MIALRYFILKPIGSRQGGQNGRKRNGPDPTSRRHTPHIPAPYHRNTNTRREPNKQSSEGNKKHASFFLTASLPWQRQVRHWLGHRPTVCSGCMWGKRDNEVCLVAAWVGLMVRSCWKRVERSETERYHRREEGGEVGGWLHVHAMHSKQVGVFVASLLCC